MGKSETESEPASGAIQSRGGDRVRRMGGGSLRRLRVTFYRSLRGQIAFDQLRITQCSIKRSVIINIFIRSTAHSVENFFDDNSSNASSEFILNDMAEAKLLDIHLYTSQGTDQNGKRQLRRR